MAVVLLITTDGSETFDYPLLQKCTLGRSSSCDLTIEDKQLSGKHGLFEINGKGEVFYSDLDSTNGSYLNNSKVQKVPFRLNDSLRVGNTKIIIDEKRLNPREKIAIGRALTNSDEKTIVVTAGTRSLLKPEAKIEIRNENKLVSQTKSDKKVLKKEAVIEQEASTGKTKILKLDINKPKKK
ncbi:MAG: FHA domain-containing protein [Bacteriovorax sp.]|jgi:pSer/pThr/pTyr-binding forkhead associated (FHA) protein